MCRNIRPLFNYDPPSTPDDARAAALQFVRKVSGSRTPSQVNQAAFDDAVNAISHEVWALLSRLETTAPSRNREAELARIKASRQKSKPVT